MNSSRRSQSDYLLKVSLSLRYSAIAREERSTLTGAVLSSSKFVTFLREGKEALAKA
jgi:hypothetical protein